MPHLVVIYGPPLSGKSSLARQIARSLGGKAAIVSPDALLEEAILVHATNAHDELEMVHTQTRLLVSNYLKNGYHVVLEGAFIYEREGTLHRHEPEIDQTLGLMRNLARSPLLVRLNASPATRRDRAATSHHAEAAGRIDAEYRQRYGNGYLELNSDTNSVQDLAELVQQRLIGG